MAKSNYVSRETYVLYSGANHAQAKEIYALARKLYPRNHYTVFYYRPRGRKPIYTMTMDMYPSQFIKLLAKFMERSITPCQHQKNT